jgi:hypothetical protein
MFDAAERLRATRRLAELFYRIARGVLRVVLNLRATWLSTVKDCGCRKYPHSEQTGRRRETHGMAEADAIGYAIVNRHLRLARRPRYDTSL